MNYWLQDLLTNLTHATSPEQLLAAVAREARGLGFDQCSFGVQLPLPLASPRILIFDNYAPAWRAQYAAQGYLSIDPVVAHGLQSLRPLVWADDMFTQNPEFWGDAQAHGLHTGWAQSLYNRQGVGGMLTLSRSNDALGATELAAHSAKLTELTQVAHECFAAQLMAQQMPEYIEPLVQHERDVLLWAFEGKTAFETAVILNMKERMVNYHLGNAIHKIDAPNKISAAVKAVRWGIL